MQANSLGVNMAGRSAGTSSISQNLAKDLISLSRRHIAFGFTLGLSADSRLANLETVQPSVVSVRHKEPCFSIRPFFYLCVCRYTK